LDKELVSVERIAAVPCLLDEMKSEICLGCLVGQI
jgi:hypothetical protein